MTEDDVVVLECEGWEALASDGWSARSFYEAVLDEHPVMLLPGGLVLDARAAMVKAMSGQPWEGYELDQVRCMQLTPDTGLVLYGVIAERIGRVYSALISSLYVRRRDGWRLAFDQQAPR